MRNPLRTLCDKLTYRNEYTNPDPAELCVTDSRRHGTRERAGRTVFHPQLPAYLDARRLRLLRNGADDIDRALMDTETLALLQRTARTYARVTIDHAPTTTRRRLRRTDPRTSTGIR